MRLGDLVYSGEYGLDNSVALVSLMWNGQSRDMRFDVDAVEDLDNPTTRWIVDTQKRWLTLQFDNISCVQP